MTTWAWCSLLVRNGANQMSISQLILRTNAKRNSISQVTSPKSRPKKRCRKHDQKPMPVFISLKVGSVLLRSDWTRTSTVTSTPQSPHLALVQALLKHQAYGKHGIPYTFLFENQFSIGFPVIFGGGPPGPRGPKHFDTQNVFSMFSVFQTCAFCWRFACDPSEQQT